MTLVSAASMRLSIIDETMNSVSSETCELYMQLSLPFFSFAVVDRKRNKFIALCEYRLSDRYAMEELTALIEHDDILGRKDFSRSCIAVFSENSTLVPSSLFNAEQAATWLSLTGPEKLNSVLCADHLRFTEAVHLYSLHSSVADLIKRHLPSSVIVHTGTVMIESEMMRNKNNTDPCIAVNIRQRSFDIIVTKGNNLLLYNCFSYQTSEDFIYFLLHVMEQLELNPEKTQLYFTGEIEKQQSIYLIAAKYIRKISFGKRPEEFEYSYGFGQTAQHMHHTLLNEYLCV